MNYSDLTPRLRDYIVCDIVFTRGANGATISEIRSDFLQKTQLECRPLRRDNNEASIRYLNSLSGLVKDQLPSGAHVWFAECFHKVHTDESPRKVSADDGIGTGSSDTEMNSVPSTHSTDPTLQIPTNIHSICVSNNGHSNLSNIPHEIPFQPVVRQINRESTPAIEITADTTNDSTLDVAPIPIQGLSIHCDVNVDRMRAYNSFYQNTESDGFGYIGDDFLLSFIINEYNFRNKMDAYPAQCGHCISGQTVTMALEELQQHPETFTASSYLVNVGAMDILIGRDIFDIQRDYKLLVEELIKLKKVPIITTLPPIVLTNEERGVWREIYQKLQLFNRYVEDHLQSVHTPFLNFWDFLTDDNGKPMKLFYQHRMTMVRSGEQVIKFALWNKLGRESLKKSLTKYLES